jgi:phosphatidate cytidylyltransferase
VSRRQHVAADKHESKPPSVRAGAFFFTLLFAFWFSGFLSDYPKFTCEGEATFMPKSLDCTPNPVFTDTTTPLPAFIAERLGITVGVQREACRCDRGKLIGSLCFVQEIPVKPIQVHGVLLAIFASIVAPFGGFLMSGIKRAYGIKDFNSLIPGHGGVTDRMDCQLVMVLATWVYYKTFIR